MRFRISHLLALAVIVAFVATALANPSSSGLEIIQFAAWLAYCVLAIRMVALSRERVALFAALLMGVSYLCLSYWMNGGLLTSTFLRWTARSRGLWNAPRGNLGYYFEHIGEIVFSFFFALVGGALGAYWSKLPQGTKE